MFDGQSTAAYITNLCAHKQHIGTFKELQSVHAETGAHAKLGPGGGTPSLIPQIHLPEPGTLSHLS